MSKFTKKEMEELIALEKFYENIEDSNIRNRIIIYKTVLPNCIYWWEYETLLLLLKNGKFTKNSYSLYKKYGINEFNLSFERVAELKDNLLEREDFEVFGKFKPYFQRFAWLLYALEEDFGEYITFTILKKVRNRYFILLSNGIELELRRMYGFAKIYYHTPREYINLQTKTYLELKENEWNYLKTKPLSKT